MSSDEVSKLGRIILERDALRFEGGPGSELVVTVPVRNTGDVLERVSVSSQKITLRSPGAIARGVRKAFKETSGDLASRLIVLGEHLSSEPAVDVTFDIKSDVSELKPGDQGKLEIRVHVPKDLRTASEWTSNVSILGSTVPVNLKVAE